MGINFPASPSVGQKHPEPPQAGVPVYTWDGEKWTTVGGSVPAYALPSTTLPLVDATPAVIGVGTSYARDDHQHPTDTSRVAKAGDVMTGDLYITKPNPALAINKAVSGQQNVLYGMTVGYPRWAIILGDGAPESSGQAGSDFGLFRYNDAGSVIDSVFGVTRSTGTTTMPYLLQANGGIGTVNLNAANVSATNNISAGNTLSTVHVSASGNVGATGQVSGTGFFCTNNTANFQSDASYTTIILNTASAYLQYDKAVASFNYIVNGISQFASTYSGNFSITGTPYRPGGGAWIDNSDARIKNVLGDYERGLDEIATLHPVYYTYKGNDTPVAPAHIKAPGEPESMEAVTVPYPNSPHKQVAVDQKKFAGLIAQEVETAFPEIVTKHAAYIDGAPVNDMRDLDTTPLVFALINAVKELKARVEALEGV